MVELSRDTIVLMDTVSDLEKENYRKGVSTVIDSRATDYYFV